MADLGTTRLPDNVDLVIWQGDAQTYTLVMNNEDGTALSLAGCTPEAIIRASFSDPTEYAFTCTMHDGNEVDLYLPSTVTDTMPAGNYVWNFQITNSTGDVRTFLAGDVTVYAQVDS